jgi:hypothetical protein
MGTVDELFAFTDECKLREVFAQVIDRGLLVEIGGQAIHGFADNIDISMKPGIGRSGKQDGRFDAIHGGIGTVPAGRSLDIEIAGPGIDARSAAGFFQEGFVAGQASCVLTVEPGGIHGGYEGAVGAVIVIGALFTGGSDNQNGADSYRARSKPRSKPRSYPRSFHKSLHIVKDYRQN